MMNLDSLVSTVTGNGLKARGLIPGKDNAVILHNVQLDSEAHPAFQLGIRVSAGGCKAA
jgi:hypothetical protein